MNKKLIGLGIGIVIVIAIIILMTVPLSKISPENPNQPNIPITNETPKPITTGKHFTVNLNETIPLSSK